MLSVQAARFVRRSMPSASRMFATQMQMEPMTVSDMKQSKHQFVKFVNKAAMDTKSQEHQELYSFLVECFVDNDTDYDGQVSFNGFNSMIAEAATAPRRFGFAPHTRELYDTKEAYEAERQALFDQLRGSNERIKLEGWLTWAKAHIQQKVGDGLEEHDEARWERSKEDYISFLKGVMQAKSSHSAKSSTSTQMKEHYMNSVRQFMAADTACNGKLDEAQFKTLITACKKIPLKHGLDLYGDVQFKDVSGNGMFVSMKDFLDYKFNYLQQKLPTIL